MRDKVGSKLFLWRKKLEHTLHGWFPTVMTPRYDLVSFSTVPYVEARQQGQRVDMLIRQGVAGVLMAFILLLGLVGIMRFTLALLAAAVIWYVLSEVPRPTRPETRSPVHSN
jgi:kynurenine 3-monooxygenase